MLDNLVDIVLKDEKIQQTLIEKIKKVVNEVHFTQEDAKRIKYAIVQKTISLIEDDLDITEEEDECPGN